MMNRRKALVTGVSAWLGGAGWLVARVSGVDQHKAVDDSLSKDLARLGKRVYSEEGIPMLLTCENLVPNQTSKGLASVSATALNAKVASAFRRYAAEWERIRPDAPATDVAKIVELLAYRDFASGGAERDL